MNDFIEQIASLVKQFAPQYGIKVYSPIIAQAVLESAMGTSDKVFKNGEWRHNYFGLKYKPEVAAESFMEIGSEQKPDGSYVTKVMMWCKFPSMAYGVKGYFDFISAPRYANLKGVTDPEQYLINIKADGYATSLKYVENVMNVIRKYDLTQYDPIKTERKDSKMKINIHAGHNPDGKVACGAVGLIKESTENRAVKDKVISKLRSLGHTVYDCTVDDGKNQSDVLQKIVAKCNANEVDLDVSIHFNSGAADKLGNGQTTGTEVYIYSTASGAKVYADNICKAIAALGFKNRGVKVGSSLYVLKNTKADALLVECCFVDDADDVKKYDPETMATAIVKGITGQTVAAKPTTTQTASPGKMYRVQCGAYSQKTNAELQAAKLRAAGFDAIIVES